MIYFSARKLPFILGEYDDDIDFTYEAGIPVETGPWEVYGACAASYNSEMWLIGGSHPEQRRQVICFAFDGHFHSPLYFRYEKSRIVHYKTLENWISIIVMVHVIHSRITEFCFVLAIILIAANWIWPFAIENAFRKFSSEGILF